ncbi:unnamed protein product [Amoebophrya sp. A25]|nr:unnamed protein product [Amoebophrya sp. A25]|eukprot:GSA25T00018624001.1
MQSPRAAGFSKGAPAIYVTSVGNNDGAYYDSIPGGPPGGLSPVHWEEGLRDYSNFSSKNTVKSLSKTSEKARGRMLFYYNDDAVGSTFEVGSTFDDHVVRSPEAFSIAQSALEDLLAPSGFELEEDDEVSKQLVRRGVDHELVSSVIHSATSSRTSILRRAGTSQNAEQGSHDKEYDDPSALLKEVRSILDKVRQRWLGLRSLGVDEFLVDLAASADGEEHSSWKDEVRSKFHDKLIRQQEKINRLLEAVRIEKQNTAGAKDATTQRNSEREREKSRLEEKCSGLEQQCADLESDVVALALKGRVSANKQQRLSISGRMLLRNSRRSGVLGQTDEETTVSEEPDPATSQSADQVRAMLMLEDSREQILRLEQQLEEALLHRSDRGEEAALLRRDLVQKLQQREEVIAKQAAKIEQQAAHIAGHEEAVRTERESIKLEFGAQQADLREQLKEQDKRVKELEDTLQMEQEKGQLAEELAQSRASQHEQEMREKDEQVQTLLTKKRDLKTVIKTKKATIGKLSELTRALMDRQSVSDRAPSVGGLPLPPPLPSCTEFPTSSKLLSVENEEDQQGQVGNEEDVEEDIVS